MATIRAAMFAVFAMRERRQLHCSQAYLRSMRQPSHETKATVLVFVLPYMSLVAGSAALRQAGGRCSRACPRCRYRMLPRKSGNARHAQAARRYARERCRSQKSVGRHGGTENNGIQQTVVWGTVWATVRGGARQRVGKTCAVSVTPENRA